MPAHADMRRFTDEAALALMLLTMLALVAPVHAETAGACAAQLPKDAKAIFDATLPKVTPTSNLRSIVTANTRTLAISGQINADTARDSAIAAALCLQLAPT